MYRSTPPVPEGFPAPFDAALMAVSDRLADAALLWERGERRRAGQVYAAAARYAASTGYLELLHLVWSHEASCVGATPAGR
jgi:hypothetical protein